VVPRGEVADEVKALDQEARGALRKHGVRFGQFTIFMPLLLKPAPTRLRLVLWSLSQGLETFPEAPPPGLVTVPTVAGAVPGTYAMSGYRAAGDRAIRIDMLERLADMLRDQDTRGGFEATADMLSITGMTLEQFAGLMEGLGYRAERGEREKVKPVDAALAEAPDPRSGAGSEASGETGPETAEAAAEQIPDDGVAPVAETAPEATEVAPEIPAAPEEETPPGEQPAAEAAPAEVEVYYTFTWAGTRRGQQARKPQGRKGAPKGKRGKPQAGGGPPAGKGAQKAAARPAAKDKQIDPDNPFAQALSGLKTK
jgi:ATP-dependent RNA helicase SUPV3L1/SUV3